MTVWYACDAIGHLRVKYYLQIVHVLMNEDLSEP